MDEMNPENPECCRRGFAASLIDTAARLLNDPSVAPRSVSKERMDLCRECDRFRADSQTCEICQCFMPLKTAAANMRCPIDRWTEYAH